MISSGSSQAPLPAILPLQNTSKVNNAVHNPAPSLAKQASASAKEGKIELTGLQGPRPLVGKQRGIFIDIVHRNNQVHYRVELPGGKIIEARVIDDKLYEVLDLALGTDVTVTLASEIFSKSRVPTVAVDKTKRQSKAKAKEKAAIARQNQPLGDCRVSAPYVPRSTPGWALDNPRAIQPDVGTIPAAARERERDRAERRALASKKRKSDENSPPPNSSAGPSGSSHTSDITHDSGINQPIPYIPREYDQPQLVQSLPVPIMLVPGGYVNQSLTCLPPSQLVMMPTYVPALAPIQPQAVYPDYALPLVLVQPGTPAAPAPAHGMWPYEANGVYIPLVEASQIQRQSNLAAQLGNIYPGYPTYPLYGAPGPSE